MCHRDKIPLEMRKASPEATETKLVLLVQEGMRLIDLEEDQTDWIEYY